MMTKSFPFLFLLLIITLALLSCGGNGEPTTPPTTDSTKVDSNKIKPKTYQTRRTDGNPILLIVATQQAIVRQKPDISSPEVARLRKHDTLVYVNILTDFTTPIKIEGIEYDEPWLQVILNDNEKAWIYGGCVRFDGLSNQELAKLVFDQRTRKLFGGTIHERIERYRKDMADLRTNSAFKLQYRRGGDLRISLETMINEHVALIRTDTIPDFFWVNEICEGFLVSYFGDEKEYRLFRDFRYWASKADSTPESFDDDFVEVFFAAYGSDSIEYKIPEWKYELENEYYSRLGEGIHKNVLDKMEIALSASDIYKKQLETTKRALIDDISLCETYWHPIDKILKELDAILAANYSFLSPADKVELEGRRTLLKDYSKHGITVNKFEG